MERGPNGMSILALDESYCQHDCPSLVEHGSCVIGDSSTWSVAQGLDTLA